MLKMQKLTHADNCYLKKKKIATDKTLILRKMGFKLLNFKMNILCKIALCF